MDAEITFIGDPGNGIEESRIIGAGLDAILAPDALTAIDDNDAVLFALVGGSRRTDVNALGMAAMIA